MQEQIELLHDALVAALDRVEGCAEWSVKVYAAAEQAARPAGVERATSGAAYLQRKREQATARQSADEESAQVAQYIHDALAGVADAARTLAPRTPGSADARSRWSTTVRTSSGRARRLVQDERGVGDRRPPEHDGRGAGTVASVLLRRLGHLMPDVGPSRRCGRRAGRADRARRPPRQAPGNRRSPGRRRGHLARRCRSRRGASPCVDHERAFRHDPAERGA